MKFVLFVESYTEDKAARDFLARCLKPHFPKLEQAGIRSVRFDGWAGMHRDIEKHARMFLQGPDSNKIVAVISLLDLYGPTIYPADRRDAQSRYAWGVDHMQKRVNDEHYRHYFAVHETEAWLLSDPSIFPALVQSSIQAVSDSPEAVNNDEPPAKMLERVYRSKLQRSYGKVADGKNLFPKLQPNIALAACPCLKQMVDDMVRLAKAYQLNEPTGKKQSQKRRD